jgi:hypothetical protein
VSLSSRLERNEEEEEGWQDLVVEVPLWELIVIYKLGSMKSAAQNDLY